MASPTWSAFRVSSRSIGVDRNRSVVKEALGNWVAEDAATFRAGMLVELSSSQKVQACTGTYPLGFSLYTKATTEYAAIVGEYIQLNGVTATTLAHANLFVPGATGGIRVAAALTGSAYTEGAGSDYTVNYTNGTVTRTAGSTIPDGGYVYCNYLYQVTEAERKFEGSNFWQSLNDVSIQDGLVTVARGDCVIFTTQYDAAQTYSVNTKLYAGTSGASLSGYVTSSAVGSFIGNVVQVPTASDPFLGLRYIGGTTS